MTSREIGSAPGSFSRTALSVVSANALATSLLTIQTPGAGFIDVTAEIAQFVKDTGGREGEGVIFFPPTSAPLTTQEKADSPVVNDLLTGPPRRRPGGGGLADLNRK